MAGDKPRADAEKSAGQRPRRAPVRRWGKRLAAAVLLLGLALWAVRVLAPTPQERLAAFDATRAVPDEDNAALIYAELLEGREMSPSGPVASLTSLMTTVLDPVSLRESQAVERNLCELEPSEAGLDPNVVELACSHSWRSTEYPRLKQWLDSHTARIDRLQEAARRPSCYFPLQATAGRMSLFDVPLGVLRQYVSILRCAANNDFGEGRIDAAVSKCQTLMSLGRHFREQPSAVHLLTGIACEAIGLHRLCEFVVQGPATDRHLEDLVAQYEKTDRDWESLRRDINQVRDIFSRLEKDQRPLSLRVYARYRRIRYGDRGWEEGRSCELYQRLLSDRRGLRILIELRRFKNRSGRWPQSLDQIASSVPGETLSDPSSERAYAYRPSRDGFVFYSVGPNRVDENGQADDWPIWPPRRMSD